MGFFFSFLVFQCSVQFVGSGWWKILTYLDKIYRTSLVTVHISIMQNCSKPHATERFNTSHKMNEEFWDWRTLRSMDLTQIGKKCHLYDEMDLLLKPYSQSHINCEQCLYAGIAPKETCINKQSNYLRILLIAAGESFKMSSHRLILWCLTQNRVWFWFCQFHLFGRSHHGITETSVR